MTLDNLDTKQCVITWTEDILLKHRTDDNFKPQGQKLRFTGPTLTHTHLGDNCSVY